MNPWEDPNSIWKTKSAYFSWLRGAMRRIWADYPLRKEWKKKSLRPVTAQEKRDKVYHPSTKNVGQCVYCKEWMAGSKLECDHKVSSDGCRDYETAEKFLWYCGAVTSDMMVLACKSCHKIKTESERRGISFAEAAAVKQAIAIQKDLDDKQWLRENGIEPASNAKARRQQIIDHLMKHK